MSIGKLVLTWGLRSPAGAATAHRGYRIVVASGTGPRNVTEDWHVESSDLEAQSLEGSAIRRGPDGTWQLFIARRGPSRLQWTIDVLGARDLRDFRAKPREAALTPGAVRLEGGAGPAFSVSDPTLFGASMLVRVAASAGGPIPTYVARSVDGVRFVSAGEALGVGRPGAWDDGQRRLSAILPLRDGLLGFYDGGRGGEEGHERTGLAWCDSGDLRGWRCLTPDAPALASPHGRGSLRSVAAIRTPVGVFFAWEREEPPLEGQREGAHVAMGGIASVESVEELAGSLVARPADTSPPSS